MDRMETKSARDTSSPTSRSTGAPGCTPGLETTKTMAAKNEKNSRSAKSTTSKSTTSKSTTSKSLRSGASSKEDKTQGIVVSRGGKTANNVEGAPRSSSTTTSGGAKSVAASDIKTSPRKVDSIRIEPVKSFTTTTVAKKVGTGKDPVSKKVQGAKVHRKPQAPLVKAEASAAAKVDVAPAATTRAPGIKKLKSSPVPAGEGGTTKVAVTSEPKVEASKVRTAEAEAGSVTRVETVPVENPVVASTSSVGVQSSPKPVVSNDQAQASSQAESLLKALGQTTSRIHEKQESLSKSIRGVASLLKARLPAQEVAQTLDEDIIQAGRVFTRTLVDLVERHDERLTRPLADICRRLDTLAGQTVSVTGTVHSEIKECAAQVDQVLDELGIERYDAHPAEVFDPMIHQAIGARNEVDLPESTVLEAKLAGYRSPNGKVLLPAQVIVNRR